LVPRVRAAARAARFPAGSASGAFQLTPGRPGTAGLLFTTPGCCATAVHLRVQPLTALHGAPSTGGFRFRAHGMYSDNAVATWRARILTDNVLPTIPYLEHTAVCHSAFLFLRSSRVCLYSCSLSVPTVPTKACGNIFARRCGMPRHAHAAHPGSAERARH
jgi:hypothetical protein